jgi:glutamine synthetase
VVGANKAFGRDIVEEHFDICLEAGLKWKVSMLKLLRQWEFQIFAKGAKDAGDQFGLPVIYWNDCEKYGVYVEWHPKPLGSDADWKAGYAR